MPEKNANLTMKNPYLYLIGLFITECFDFYFFKTVSFLLCLLNLQGQNQLKVSKSSAFFRFHAFASEKSSLQKNAKNYDLSKVRENINKFMVKIVHRDLRNLLVVSKSRII